MGRTILAIALRVGRRLLKPVLPEPLGVLPGTPPGGVA